MFPLAFVRYLDYFAPINSELARFGVHAGLMAVIVAVNISGIRRGSRLNDLLTLGKLVPLAVVILAGILLLILHGGAATAHLSPFAPIGFGGFGTATVLIFWAYAGFELSVLPAGEVQDPRRTLPRGLLFGMAIATVIYLLTAFAVVLALPSSAIAASPRPLADALSASVSHLGLNNAWAAGFVSAGALISIVGVCDVYMLGVARLSYALAREAAFPAPFGRLHAKYRTPWVGLLFQGILAVAASQFFDISGVLGTAVFFLGICYALTALAAVRLANRYPAQRLHLPALRVLFVLAAASGAYLTAQAEPRLMLGGGAALAVAFTAVKVAPRLRAVRLRLRHGL